MNKGRSIVIGEYFVQKWFLTSYASSPFYSFHKNMARIHGRFKKSREALELFELVIRLAKMIIIIIYFPTKTREPRLTDYFSQSM